MKKISFCRENAPYITAMIQETTPQKAIARIRNSISEGATAIGYHLEMLGKEYRTAEQLKNIFSYAQDKPIYITNYDWNEKSAYETAEERFDELFLALDCGATLIDVPGDTFAEKKTPDELTFDTAAVEKQMRLIEKIHERGGEALISSHVLKYREPEAVLAIAKEQQRRGADVIKIVTAANSEAEEEANLRACSLLKKELEKPFLFLAGGTHCQLLRNLGPFLGAHMWLTVQEYTEVTAMVQPLLKNVVAIKNNMDCKPNVR